jgi:putative transposase
MPKKLKIRVPREPKPPVSAAQWHAAKAAAAVASTTSMPDPVLDVSVDLKCRKVRLWFTREEQVKLRQWFGTARFMYNKALVAYQNKEVKMTLDSLKSAFGSGITLAQNKSERWILDVPSKIRTGALRDLLKAYESNMEKGEKFQLRFRSRKDGDQSIALERETIRDGILFPRYLDKAMPLSKRCSEELPADLGKRDCRLVRDRLGRYTLCIPVPTESHTPLERKQVVSIDPGVRAFHTFYSPDGEVCGQIGIGQARLKQYTDRIDKIRSRRALLPKEHPKIRKLARAEQRRQERVKNLVKELHHKTALYYVRNYECVLLPSFDVSRMVENQDPTKSRTIGKRTVRSMLDWRHYQFKQHLLHKAKEYNCQVVVTGEAYTTRTCGCCGYIKSDVGSSEVFSCNKCRWRCGRDYNAARNVLLLHIQ